MIQKQLAPAPIISVRYLAGVLAALSLAVVGILALQLALIMSDRVGTFQNRAQLVDLNGDGSLDVVLHNVRSEAEFTAFSQTTFWMNQGNGRFAPRLLDLDPYLYVAARAADIDGDADADMLLLSAHELMVYHNQGGLQGGVAGEFRHTDSIAPPLAFSQFGTLLAGDLDGNETADALIAGCCGRAFSDQGAAAPPSFSWVWTNEPATAAFAGHTAALAGLEGLPLRDAVFGDLDGDGDLDLLIAVEAATRQRRAGSLLIYFNQNGALVDSGQRLGAGQSTVALGDLDRDGDLDVLAAGRNSGVVWMNQGGMQHGAAGSFTESRELFKGRVSAAFLNDLNGDGAPDALIATERYAVVWWNDGQGTLSRSNQVLHYSERYAPAIGDLDGDGDPDVLACAYADDCRVWFNQGAGVFEAR